MDQSYIILTGALLISVVSLGLLLTRRNGAAKSGGESTLVAEKIITNAEREAEMLRQSAELELKDQRLTAQAELAEQKRAAETALQRQSAVLTTREGEVENRGVALDQQQAQLDQHQQQVSERQDQLDQQAEALKTALEKLSAMTAEEAKAELLRQYESDARFESAKLLQRLEEETKAQADDNARHVIGSAIQRIAGDYVVESTITVMHLPSEDMKGRIIGREGRNIRALESATGVNLIIDDTPETVLLSSFDPFRREVAHQTLERLMADGRFHPTRIEETVEAVTTKLESEMREEANKVIFELDIHDLHPDIVGLLGRLKYRLSYGQNNLAHAREVALICAMMADELGLDRKLAMRGGLLHDIGKSLTQEVQGGHATIGADFAKKCGEHPDVVNAIGSHHGDIRPTTKEAYLVAAGDALSAGRPGARRESMELYVKRLEDLEEAASTFPGVQKVYAMQAGREVRVMVDADTLSDDECHLISRDIANKIEQELTYPGQVKICLVRESRFIEYAR